jgi:uncharacterized oxidoreductase
MKIAGRTILVTGGATGIGLGLARRMVAAGATVIASGRREDALAEARAQVRGLHTLRGDVSTAEGRTALAEQVLREHPALDVLVNNAGIQNHLPPLTQPQDWSAHERELQTNLAGPMHLTMLLLPHLLARAEAAILNVTSGLSFAPYARVATYCATKAALHSWTQSLRWQLAETKVTVVEIIPPAVNTDLGGKGLHDHGEPLDGFCDHVMRHLARGDLEFGYKGSEEARTSSRDQLDKRFAAMNGRFR